MAPMYACVKHQITYSRKPSHSIPIISTKNNLANNSTPPKALRNHVHNMFHSFLFIQTPTQHYDSTPKTPRNSRLQTQMRIVPKITESSDQWGRSACCYIRLRRGPFVVTLLILKADIMANTYRKIDER